MRKSRVHAARDRTRGAWPHLALLVLGERVRTPLSEELAGLRSGQAVGSRDWMNPVLMNRFVAVVLVRARNERLVEAIVVRRVSHLEDTHGGSRHPRQGFPESRVFRCLRRRGLMKHERFFLGIFVCATYM